MWLKAGIASLLVLPVVTAIVALPLLINHVNKQKVEGAKKEEKSSPHGLCLPPVRWIGKNTQSKNRSKKVILVTYGTRGDIQPIVSLAIELSNVGIQCLITCPDCYKGFVESFGVRFESMGVKDVPQPDYLFDPNATSIGDVLEQVRDVYPTMSTGVLNVVRKHQDSSLIIATAITRSICLQVAEYFKVPVWYAEFAPNFVYTKAFPPAGYSQSRFGWLNKLKYIHRDMEIVKGAVANNLHVLEKHFREETLGLPPKTLTEGLGDRLLPTLHSWSQEVAGLPQDYPPWSFQTGFWRIAPEIQIEKSGFNPSSPLLKFLEEDRNNGVVFVTFGSMLGSLEATHNVILGLLRFGVEKVVVCANESRAEQLRKRLSPQENDCLFFVSPIPYCWILERCSLIIHHGGAGTTAEAMCAGVPSIIVPLLMWSDQPYWADTVERKRMGYHLPKPCLLNDPLGSMRDALNTVRELNMVKIPFESQNGASVASSIVLQYVDNMNSMEPRRHSSILAVK